MKKMSSLFLILISTVMLLSSCGNVSDSTLDTVRNDLLNDNIIESYIKSNSNPFLIKGDFSKELGVIEYTLYLNVNRYFYVSLSDSEKHYLAQRISNDIVNYNLKCSGTKECRVTKIFLTFDSGDSDYKSYIYYIDTQEFINDNLEVVEEITRINE